MGNQIALYHGSANIIKNPVFGMGNCHNDYGLGFYCSDEIELAKEWACTENESGYVNYYPLDLSNLNIMRLSGGGYNILNWLALLLDNRTFRVSNPVAAEGRAYLLDKFLPDIKSYDCIVGYRADDSYFSFASGFLNNTISLEQLEFAMYLGKLGEQTVMKSKKSFDKLRFVRCEAADKDIYFPKRKERDANARLSYQNERAKQRAADAVYLVDILREGGLKSDDARIRRNLPGRCDE